MNMKIVCYLCLLSLITVGCGNGQSVKISEYAGIWYDIEYDRYIEVFSNGDYVLYRCTVNDGYVTNGEILGNFNGDELTVYHTSGDETLSVERVENGIIIIEDGYTFLHEKAEKIPETCSGDAVDITYHSPESAKVGELTTFIVDFDYRLTSSSHAMISIFFTSSQYGSITSKKRIEVFPTELESDTLTDDTIPLIFENGEPFELYVIMSDLEDGEWKYKRLSTDSVIINVY